MSTLPSGDRRVDYSAWQRHNYSIGGAQVAVHRAGSGEPVVYLHGGGTWHGLAFTTGLPEHFEVFLPHHPGFGLSENNPNITSVADCVEHYRTLFDAMNLKRVHLIGSSLGGRIAAEFAARYPERVSKLILAAPAGLIVADHPLPDLSSVAPQDFPAYLVSDFQLLLPFLPTGPDEEFMAMREREFASTMQLLPSGLENPDMPALLHRISAPTLIIWGNGDRLIPSGQAKHWQQLIPNANFTVIEGVGHLPLDESERARRSVLDFLF